jgi:hypothetical protein
MMREADLDRHLTSEEEKKAIDAIKTALPDAKKSDAKESDAKEPDAESSKAEDEKPVVYKAAKGSDGLPIDFVLQQALNHLNGQAVAANPREWLVMVNQSRDAKPVAAVAAANPATPEAKPAAR